MDGGTAHRSHLTGRYSPPRLHDAAPGARRPRPDLAPKFSDHRLRQGLNPRRFARKPARPDSLAVDMETFRSARLFHLIIL